MRTIALASGMLLAWGTGAIAQQPSRTDYLLQALQEQRNSVLNLDVAARAERMETIDHLTYELADKNKEIETLKKELTDKNKEIVVLKKELAEFKTKDKPDEK